MLTSPDTGLRPEDDKQRLAVERSINRLERNRGPATRFDNSLIDVTHPGNDRSVAEAFPRVSPTQRGLSKVIAARDGGWPSDPA